MSTTSQGTNDYRVVFEMGGKQYTRDVTGMKDEGEARRYIETYEFSTVPETVETKFISIEPMGC